MVQLDPDWYWKWAEVVKTLFLRGLSCKCEGLSVLQARLARGAVAYTGDATGQPMFVSCDPCC